jgi:ABC-2 type transport system ATP-binding protein
VQVQVIPLVEFRGVGKEYQAHPFSDPVCALDEVWLDARPGEVLGIAGPNGAGKSTLISILLGYVRPTSGVVLVDGLSPRGYIERHGIGYLSEFVEIDPRWTVREALTRFATLGGVPDALIALRSQQVMARLGLEELGDRKFKHLSKGNKQRLGLAQALLREERVLILDEPTHGLDPVWLMRFRGIVASLRRPGRTILIASHNLEELERLCDRVAIFDRGRLQRVVEVTRVLPQMVESLYRLTIARGAERLSEVFPGVEDLGRGDWAVYAPTLESLNEGLAALLSRGVLIAGIAPARSALELEFHEAVAEVAV